MTHTHTHLGHIGWHQGFRTYHPHLGATQGGQGVDVRPGHAGVKHIPNNGHCELAEVFFVVPDGVHIQQSLSGVGMPAVSRVDHVHVGRNVLCNQIGSARLPVAHDEQVRGHGTQVGDGVQQGLSLGRGRARDVQINHVCRQPRGCNFERGSGTGGVFKKEVEDTLAAKQRDLFDLAVADADKTGGCVQDLRQCCLWQALNGQQMNQFAVFIELRVSAVQHAQTSRMMMSAVAGNGFISSPLALEN